MAFYAVLGRYIVLYFNFKIIILDDFLKQRPDLLKQNPKKHVRKKKSSLIPMYNANHFQYLCTCLCDSFKDLVDDTS